MRAQIREWAAITLCLLLALGGAATALALAHGADEAMRPRQDSLRMAPDFTVAQVDGSGTITLSALRGKVVLLDLMASWCTACIAGMPQLVAINASYADAPFLLISIGTDDLTDSADAVAQYALQYGGTWTFTFDAQGVVRFLYDVAVYPTFVLVGADGTLLWSGKGNPDDAALRQRIDSALAAAG